MDQDENIECATASEHQKNAPAISNEVATTSDQIEDNKNKEDAGSSWSWNSKPGIIIKSLWYKNLNELALAPERTPFDWNWLYVSLKNAVKEYNLTQAEHQQHHFDSSYLQNFAVTTARYTWLGDDAMRSKTYE